MKKFINPDWKALRKLAPSLKQAWFYLWDKADSIGVYEHDEDYFRIDNGFDIEFSELEKLPNVQKISETKILLLDYIIVNYGQLKENYNPHKPAFRDLQKNNLKLNSSLNQACPKLEDEDKDKDEEEDKDEGVIEKKEKAKIEKKVEPKSLIPENFPFKSPEAIKAMEDYITHRRQLKVKPYTQKGLEMAMKEWSRWGEAMFIEAVYNSIRNNYQGLFPPNSNKNNETKTTQPTGPSNKFEAEQQRKQGLAALLERNKRILNGYAESDPDGSNGNQQESEQYSDYFIVEERRGGGGDDGEGKLIDNGGGSSAEHR